MLALEYDANVELTAHHANPATINETPINRIPLSILPFLLPSRYVPSDRLAAFARAEFGSLLPGHKGVNAICGWIYDHLEFPWVHAGARSRLSVNRRLAHGRCR
jgi:hypothetical protein